MTLIDTKYLPLMTLIDKTSAINDIQDDIKTTDNSIWSNTKKNIATNNNFLKDAISGKTRKWKLAS